MSRIFDEAAGMKEELIADRRYLHQHAEVGDRLPVTVKYVKERLAAMGYAPQEICGCGVAAVAGGGHAGRTFLLRADMDALAMEEESGLPFASLNKGCAHTCGHDLHTAMLLGAARLLKKREDELDGTVKLMFQPDEEGLTGAEAMIRAGILEHPRVDAAMAMRVTPGPAPPGVIALKAGPVMAASDHFRITVRGRGGHGAHPDATVDPVSVGAHIHIALQAIQARENDPMSPLAVTVGIFRAGDAFNVIPDTAVLEGSIRSFSKEQRAFVKKRVADIAAGTATAFRASCSVEFVGGTAVNRNDGPLLETLKTCLAQLPIRQTEAEWRLSSEDFSLISDAVPSAYLFLGAGGAEPEYASGALHSPRVLFNEDALPYGAAALAACALGWLKRNR